MAAFTRSGKDVTEPARTICNLPLELPEDGQAVSEELLKIRGEIYGPNPSRTKSKALAAGHLRKKIQLELVLVLLHMTFLVQKMMRSKILNA